MFKIREEQMNVLSQYMTKNFENRLVCHVKEYFPDEFQSLGELEVHDRVVYGIEKARTYQFTSENYICKYINIIFAFGDKDFDTNMSLPWATEILNNPNLKKTFFKIRALSKKAELEFEQGINKNF